MIQSHLTNQSRQAGWVRVKTPILKPKSTNPDRSRRLKIRKSLVHRQRTSTITGELQYRMRSHPIDEDWVSLWVHRKSVPRRSEKTMGGELQRKRNRNPPHPLCPTEWIRVGFPLAICQSHQYGASTMENKRVQYLRVPPGSRNPLYLHACLHVKRHPH